MSIMWGFLQQVTSGQFATQAFVVTNPPLFFSFSVYLPSLAVVVGRIFALLPL